MGHEDFSFPSADDLAVVERQIGRPPRSVMAVAARCRWGRPTVVASSPLLEGGTPFPTVFWLSCPVLVSAVGRLEGQGLIRLLEDEIAADEEPARDLAHAQRAIAQYREELADQARLAEAAESIESMRELGIGGTSDHKRLKCLHAHYAFYLATGLGPAGRSAHRMLAGERRMADCSWRCRP